ncbi:hypothetical protein [Vibrio crassostreae]|uniref:hypothetical protein n=1 Tax=Vibrio crassostreae TaxID=246167 RepID=UPI001B30B622|nr:hypothetical protein [Vibrio crassostreae]
MFKNGILASLCVIGLSACSSSQLTVFDGLTYTAENEGGYDDPIRFYPLQTTQVSLDGQLNYKIGDLCYADRNRSPMTANCLADSLRNSQFEASVIVHNYPLDDDSEANKAKNAKGEAVPSEITDVNEENKDSVPVDVKTAALDLTNALSATTLTLATCKDDAECAKDIETNRKAINKANDDLQKATSEVNVRVYNWSDNVSASGSNKSKNVEASSEKKTEGYTIVSGYKVFELRMKCIDESRISAEKSDHLKVVTKLISADSISFINTQSKLNKLRLKLDAADIKNASTAFIKELAALEVALQSASTISSMAKLHKESTKPYSLYKSNSEKPSVIAKNALKKAQNSKEHSDKQSTEASNALEAARKNAENASTARDSALGTVKKLNAEETTTDEELTLAIRKVVDVEIELNNAKEKLEEAKSKEKAAKQSVKTSNANLRIAEDNNNFAMNIVQNYEKSVQTIIDNSKGVEESMPLERSVYLAVLTDLDDLKEHFPACSETPKTK